MASKNGFEARVAALIKWAMRSQSVSSIKAMVESASTEPGVPIMPDELDGDPMLINVHNGILDLRTGTLRPPRREAYMTMTVRTHFDTDAQCPTFERFLEQNTNGDSELIAFKRRLYGSCLTGSVHDQKLFIAYGSGANGKSTELNAMREILGDYAAQTASETLIQRRPGAASNDLVRLRGRRFVTAQETESGDRLASALIKQMTGGDVVTARRLYQEFEEIVPTWKVVLSTNHLPEIDGGDLALLRRLVLIPFDHVVPPDERDPNLKEKLIAEAPGIFKWMVEGCLEWQEIGLQEPARVRAAVEAYRVDTDPIGSWLEEDCEVGLFETPAVDLYSAFRSWCIVNDAHDTSQVRFGRSLAQRGFPSVKKGTTFRVGLRLKKKRLN